MIGVIVPIHYHFVFRRISQHFAKITLCKLFWNFVRKRLSLLRNIVDSVVWGRDAIAFFSNGLSGDWQVLFLQRWTTARKVAGWRRRRRLLSLLITEPSSRKGHQFRSSKLDPGKQNTRHDRNKKTNPSLVARSVLRTSVMQRQTRIFGRANENPVSKTTT